MTPYMSIRTATVIASIHQQICGEGGKEGGREGGREGGEGGRGREGGEGGRRRGREGEGRREGGREGEGGKRFMKLPFVKILELGKKKRVNYQKAVRQTDKTNKHTLLIPYLHPIHLKAVVDEIFEGRPPAFVRLFPRDLKEQGSPLTVGHHHPFSMEQVFLGRQKQKGQSTGKH